jgi:hypothetical protein
MKKLRCKIGAVRPNYRVKLRVHAEGLEDFDVLKWLEDGAFKFVS